MQIHSGERLFSASDLVNFIGCAHNTFLDLRNLVSPVKFPPDDDAATLLQEKGIEHERGYLHSLRSEGRSVIEIDSTLSMAEKVRLTREALQAGPDVIYQGAFIDGSWQGFSDFLLRVDLPSDLGTYSYEVADTKLSQSAKPKHLLQLSVYSDILTREQGIAPVFMHVVLGDRTIATVRVDSVIHYFQFARDRFLSLVGSPPASSSGVPCGHCTFCRWASQCDSEWETSNHLSIVAGLTSSQAEALHDAAIPDLIALSKLPLTTSVAGIQPETLARLRNQARLQAGQRETGQRKYELLNIEPSRGLLRLPQPDPGDIFFDMEGDPLYDGGLEYLFGFITLEGQENVFHPFWAHSRDEERSAFQAAVDFLTNRLREFPRAHIYHYAAYEETALKRLSMLHGTREAEVDALLRHHKLVDLYRVVKEAIRTSEPRYSIKNMEKFYLPNARSGEVKTAGDSIVIYERWRRLEDQQLLNEISDYNRLDCVSTLHCRDWLIGMRPAGSLWYTHQPEADAAKSEERSAAEMRVAAMAGTLLQGDGSEQLWRQLIVDLLEFHRRESKPSWWSIFSKQDMRGDELLEDAECLANIERDPHSLLRYDKKSRVITYRYPAQDFKLKKGDKPIRAGTLEPAGEIVSIDEDALTISLKLGPTRSDIVDGASLLPPGPIGDNVLREAIYRFAEAIRLGRLDRYPAVLSILRRELPRFNGRSPGSPVVMTDTDILSETIAALLSLDASHLLIQGPPGTGKTFTASQAIVALLERGKRVGVASNGHKAINQLIGEVELLAKNRGYNFRGIKKSSQDDQMLNTGGWIEETLSNDDISSAHQLVAGTAWLFAREEHDLAFDYLFVDEAGQVGLANIVAMGLSARNIVLVGDQMQLAQPVQGTHPRGSGVSALEHILQDLATVPPERGIFLSETRRMHPDVCGFISDAVYDGRLRATPGTERQVILANTSLDKEAIAASGLRFVSVDTVACTQRSPLEAERLNITYRALLGQAWRDKDGIEYTIGVADILVVSPYNMQVELLKRTLPDGARVGTVDKFQGQEAAVVLISMTTSSGEDLPRNIEFLYSRNRLNVAISRARCLAVVYANPRLLETPCNTVDQMQLVNGLCWAKHYADEQRGGRPL